MTVPSSEGSTEYLLTAAIDFGTTYSCYAFSIIPPNLDEKSKKFDTADIRMNKNWGCENSCSLYKTPTSVLTGPDGEFRSFGLKAERDYALSIKKEDANEYNLYRHFKMMLMKERKVTEQTTILSTSGHPAYAVDIFAMALEFLKDHLLKAIEDSGIVHKENKHMQWVITVPAIWTDSAKRFMRKACLKAGLISKIDSSQLLIALEPEAASIYCRSVKSYQFHGTCEEKDVFKTGEKYLIIDAGGGTLDISAHEILTSGDVKEICPPSGGPWGGICADKAFEQLFLRIFGDKFINNYKKEKPRDWLQIMTTFESSKSLIEVDEENDCNINLSYTFGKEIAREYNMDLEDYIEKKKDLGVSFADGFLCISPKVAKSLFKAVIDDITVHLQTLLEGKVVFDYVLLVGGFGQCKLLQDAVKRVFQDKAKVLIPLEAQLAIVQGAVIYGYRPSNIQSRIAKYSYGYSVTLPFNKKIHNQKYKDFFKGIDQCTNLFKVIIEKGKDVTINTKVKHKVGSDDYWSTIVELYSADTVDVMYADSSLKGVRRHGNIKIEHDSYSYKDSRPIEIITVFGGTELFIKARDAESGTWYDTSINFFDYAEDIC